MRTVNLTELRRNLALRNPNNAELERGDERTLVDPDAERDIAEGTVTHVAWAVADAFGLGRPTGALVANSHRSSETWRLDTVDGQVLVKQVEVAGRTAEVQRAWAFERLVAERGLAMPRPLAPAGEVVGEVVGPVAFVDGLGHVRCSEWVDGRDLADDDDVAGWLGRTMAAIHAVEPVAAPDPVVYGVHPVEQWQVWLDAGERSGRPWAAVLKDRLAELLEIVEWIAAALDRSSDYVMSHRDIEPWNVMVTTGGPVLVDWDMAGPDSAELRDRLTLRSPSRPGAASTVWRRTSPPPSRPISTPAGGCGPTPI